MTLSIQIASDLHIEYNNDKCVNPLDYITPVADVLILAGDIGSLYKYHQLYSFIDGLVPHFKHILFIPGNHEYYKQPNYDTVKSMSQLKSLLENLSMSWDNFTVLDGAAVNIEDVCIVGATLWSDPGESIVPKFIVRIHGISTEIYKKMHKRDLLYIERMVKYCKENDMKMICVTHHPPTDAVTENIKKKNKYRFLYSTDLSRLLVGDDIQTWVCGHVHKNFDFVTENGCRVVGNQKGKPKDKIQNYEKSFLL